MADILGVKNLNSFFYFSLKPHNFLVISRTEFLSPRLLNLSLVQFGFDKSPAQGFTIHSRYSQPLGF